MAHIAAGLAARRARSRRLQAYGVAAIATAIAFLCILLGTIFANGYTALQQTEIAIDIELPVEKLTSNDGAVDLKKLRDFNWDGVVKKAFRAKFPDVTGMMDKRSLGELISANAGYEMRLDIEQAGFVRAGRHTAWIKASDDVDMLIKGRLDRALDESSRRIKDNQLGWIDKMVANDEIRLSFNKTFFTAADSREPESAGILGAIVGSAMALVVTVLLALPLAIMSSTRAISRVSVSR